ncbi:MAG: hypothetical protein R2932_30830 [Caldilineaceae bacterium]
MTGQLPTTQPYLIEVNTVARGGRLRTLRVALAPTANSGAERQAHQRRWFGGRTQRGRSWRRPARKATC